MPLIPMKPILDEAYKYKIAFGAFNINSPTQAKAVIQVHEMFRTAAIIQVVDFAHGFMAGRKDYLNATLEEKTEGAKRMAEAVSKYAQDANIPVALHLDHGSDPEFVKACIDCGYTSVMIDGSKFPFEKNIEITADVVKYAHSRGVTVEGELGVLGGREDHTEGKTYMYTDPNQVCEFFERTGVDCLAISYGTSHGPAKGKNAKIRKEIAIAASENMSYKGIKKVLVSHGSSTVPGYIVEEINALGGNLTNAYGIPFEQVAEVIPYGIGKINIGTDLRLSILRYIREYFNKYPQKIKRPTLAPVWDIISQKPELIDERVYLYPIADSIITGDAQDEDTAEIMECMHKGIKEIVGQLVVQFGQVGYANKVQSSSLKQMAEYYGKQA
jgi:fructose-bisphosphate aldolase class II